LPIDGGTIAILPRRQPAGVAMRLASPNWRDKADPFCVKNRVRP